MDKKQMNALKKNARNTVWSNEEFNKGLEKARAYYQNYDYEKAKQEYAKLYKKYPEKLSAKFGILEFIRVLIIMKDYEKADRLFSKYYSEAKDFSLYERGVLEASRKNYAAAEKIYKFIISNGQYDENMPMMRLLFLYIKQGKYEEAFNIFNSISFGKCNDKKSFSSSVNPDYILHFLKSRMGMLEESDFNEFNPYSIKQIESYSKEAAVKETERGKDKDFYRNSFFYEYIDIERLYEKIKEKLSDDNLLYFSFVDKYIVDVGELVGEVDGEATSFVEVVTEINTDNIIFVYPAKRLRFKQRKRD